MGLVVVCGWIDRSLPGGDLFAFVLCAAQHQNSGDRKAVSDLFAVFSAPLFHIVLNWQNAIFTINTLLYEMDLGANRISDIVKAFKTYTYMDQIPLQEVDIHKDLDNTLIIFSSKLKHGITLERKYAPDLPKVEAYGSELNQVWTNADQDAPKVKYTREWLTRLTTPAA